MSETDLVLSTIGTPPYACRGVTQDLRPIDAGQLKRDVNGSLVNLGLEQHKKYRSTITFQDVQPMPLQGVFKGSAVTVSCIRELGVEVTLIAGAAIATLSRIPVTGSGRAIFRAAAAADDDVHVTSNVVFSLPTGESNYHAAVDFGDAGYTGKAYIYYRPRLSMLVVDTSMSFDEWAAQPGDTIELEEV